MKCWIGNENIGSLLPEVIATDYMQGVKVEPGQANASFMCCCDQPHHQRCAVSLHQLVLTEGDTQYIQLELH